MISVETLEDVAEVIALPKGREEEPQVLRASEERLGQSMTCRGVNSQLLAVTCSDIIPDTASFSVQGNLSTGCRKNEVIKMNSAFLKLWFNIVSSWIMFRNMISSGYWFLDLSIEPGSFSRVTCCTMNWMKIYFRSSGQQNDMRKGRI